MKALITIFAFFFCYQIKAQNSYNNKIAEVKELNIYGKDANVIIGKLIINTNSPPQPIKLLRSMQQQQPDGTYITFFYFGNDNVTPLYNVDLKIVFNKPVDTLKERGIIMYTGDVKHNGLSKDKMSYKLTASEINASMHQQTLFLLFIKSRYKIEATITGADSDN